MEKMFRTINIRNCILVYIVLFLTLSGSRVFAATEEDNYPDMFVIGKASVQFKGCNNLHELISSGLTVVMQNSHEGEGEPVENEIVIETDQKGVFVSKLVYPRLSSVKEIRYKDLWQIPLSEEGSKLSYDVTEKGMCKEQGMAITFMDIRVSVNNECSFAHDATISFGPNNEVAELLFHAILSLQEKDEFIEDLKQCLDDVIERRSGEAQN